MKERRKILEDNIQPIKNHVQLSEYHIIRNPKELSVMIAKVRTNKNKLLFQVFASKWMCVRLFNFLQKNVAVCLIQFRLCKVAYT